jgi:hypothetical protein
MFPWSQGDRGGHDALVSNNGSSGQNMPPRSGAFSNVMVPLCCATICRVRPIPEPPLCRASPLSTCVTFSKIRDRNSSGTPEQWSRIVARPMLSACSTVMMISPRSGESLIALTADWLKPGRDDQHTSTRCSKAIAHRARPSASTLAQLASIACMTDVSRSIGVELNMAYPTTVLRYRECHLPAAQDAARLRAR